MRSAHNRTWAGASRLRRTGCEGIPGCRAEAAKWDRSGGCAVEACCRGCGQGKVDESSMGLSHRMGRTRAEYVVRVWRGLQRAIIAARRSCSPACHMHVERSSLMSSTCGMRRLPGRSTSARAVTVRESGWVEVGLEAFTHAPCLKGVRKRLLRKRRVSVRDGRLSRCFSRQFGGFERELSD